VLNPGHVDPGYNGPLTVKALNLRKTPISISLGLPIFTIVFLRLSESTEHPYNKNQPDRDEKEAKFHATEQERTPTSLADLLRVSDDLPMVSGDAMDRAIRKHWMTRTTLILAAIAAIFSVIGPCPGRSDDRTQKPAVARDSVVVPQTSRPKPSRQTPRQGQPTTPARKPSTGS